MARVLRALPVLLLTLALAACGGSSSSKPPTLGSAATTASGTARFTLSIAGKLGGTTVEATETGSISFTQRRAHLYKLNPGGGLPQELVLIGPLTYTNANVQAATQDSSVKPWTKLDTRRLTKTQLLERPDELAHVRALAYLADGAAGLKTIGTETVESTRTTHIRGTVDPRRVVARASASERESVRRAIRSDYLDKPFPADFWIDADGRLRRVRVNYRTNGGTRITLDGGFSDFGVKLDLKLPPASAIADITP
jgi:hypothetical protein